MSTFYSPSPALAEIVGRDPMSLLEVSDRFWSYVTVRGHDFRVAEVTGSTKPLELFARTPARAGSSGPQRVAACLSLHLKPS